MNQRQYLETHPWVSFRFDVTGLPPETLFDLGEVLSKCDHVSGAPLPPGVAQTLNKVFLTKGVHATTSIEGNTLTEDEVSQRLEGGLPLPSSMEYQGEEIDNLLEILNEINVDCGQGALPPISSERIREWNKRVLAGQPLEDGVTPGEFRTFGVTVGKAYRGVPAEDCDYLMDRFVTFINDELRAEGAWERPVAIIRAIIAHLYFAWIHPFGDGNGRTARLIEFQLLLEAGLPIPAAHLLSDYYNRTRARYYQALDRASNIPDRNAGVSQFVSYAVNGFAEGLRAQVDDIEYHQLEIAWKSYVHEVVSAENHTEAWRRRRELALTTPLAHTHDEALTRSQLTKQTPELFEMYVGKSTKTLTRDINALVERGLLRKIGTRFTSSKDLMAAFLPAVIETT